MPRERDPDEPKIYFLPNLMTALNLACGFFAVLMIFKGITEARLFEVQKMTGTAKLPPKEYYEISKTYYEYAILLIFGSCLFDLLDGRLARLGGQGVGGRHCKCAGAPARLGLRAAGGLGLRGWCRLGRRVVATPGQRKRKQRGAHYLCRGWRPSK